MHFSHRYYGMASIVQSEAPCKLRGYLLILYVTSMTKLATKTNKAKYVVLKYSKECGKIIKLLRKSGFYFLYIRKKVAFILFS